MLIYRFVICRRDRQRTFAGSFSEWSLNVAQIISSPGGSGVCRQCGRNKLTRGRRTHKLLSAAQPGNEQHPISDGRFQLQRQSGSQRRPAPIQLELRTVFLAAGILGQFHWRGDRYAADGRHVHIQRHCVGFIEEQRYRSADSHGGGSGDYADTNTHTNTHAYADTYTNNYINNYNYININTNTNTHTYTNTNTDTNTDTNTYTDTDTDTNTNTNTYANTYANTDTDTNTYANTDTDTDTDTNTYANTNPHAYGPGDGNGAHRMPESYEVRHVLFGE